MTQIPVFSWPCEELKCSVDKSGRLDDAKQNVF